MYFGCLLRCSGWLVRRLLEYSGRLRGLLGYSGWLLSYLSGFLGYSGWFSRLFWVVAKGHLRVLHGCNAVARLFGWL